MNKTTCKVKNQNHIEKNDVQHKENTCKNTVQFLSQDSGCQTTNVAPGMKSEIHTKLLSSNTNVENKVKTKTFHDLESNTEYVEVLSNTCWYLSGAVGNLKTDFLIDSGSTNTVVDFDLYNSIP